LDDSNSDSLRAASPSLKLALRRARIEAAEQNQAFADLREAEVARLQALEDAIQPVIDQVPAEVDMFEPGILHGERPRLFIDMIGFVEMGHDRRVYRLMQDTRHGRVLIAQSERIDTMTAAVANYIARRLIERERALASDWRSDASAPSETDVGARARALAAGIDRPANDETGPLTPGLNAATPAAAGWRLGDALWSGSAFLLLLLGSMTLWALIAFAVFGFWGAGARAFWTAYFGAPPF
jgi:hypothetical protein